MLRKALTIAGSDSGGGAGIQADLKVFAAHRVYGLSAVASLTAQNSTGVQGVFDCPPEFVARQIESVMEDIGCDAAKTGMLGNGAVVKAVADQVRKHRIVNLVVDPVLVSKNSIPLLQEDAVETLLKELFPQAILVTPNLPELKRLTGMNVQTLKERESAAKQIRDRYGCSVLVKGGHDEGEAVTDFLLHSNEFRPFQKPRISTPHTHGTGCTLSAAITARLALGVDLLSAVASAEEYMETAIRDSFPLGSGRGPTDPLSEMYRNEGRWVLYKQMCQALHMLEVAEIGRFIPEVQSNLAACLPHPRGWEDVIAVPGRIIRFGNTIRTLSPPDFGVSRHVASIVMAIAGSDLKRRAVMNIRYRPDAVEAARRFGWTIGEFSRKDEPKGVKEKEGSSLEWGTLEVIRKLGFVPDLIYDLGGEGKEEMIRITGESPIDVAQKIIRIVSVLD